jgi:hypothetical protein
MQIFPYRLWNSDLVLAAERGFHDAVAPLTLHFIKSKVDVCNPENGGRDARLAVELDREQHFTGAEAYRRDRRKDYTRPNHRRG